MYILIDDDSALDQQISDNQYASLPRHKKLKYKYSSGYLLSDFPGEEPDKPSEVFISSQSVLDDSAFDRPKMDLFDGFGGGSGGGAGASGSWDSSSDSGSDSSASGSDDCGGGE